MLQKIAILTGLLALVATAPLQANLGDDNPMRPDIVGWGTDATTAPIIGIDHDGDLLPARSLQYDIGSSTKQFRKVYAGSIDSSSGIINVSEMFVDLSSGVLRGAVPTAGLTIPTSTLLGGATTYVDHNLTQSTGAPRNVIMFSSANILVPTTTLIMSATFYGYNGKGEWTTEWIVCSTNTIQWSTASVTNDSPLEYRGVGNVAWSYISSVTISISSMTDQMGLTVENPRLYIGYGQKIGLANNITETTDIYKITNAGGGDVSNSTTNPLISINTDMDTIVFSPQPNGVDEKKVWYRFKRKH